MGRKFRLHHKKQKYVATTFVVSIPRSVVTVLGISILLDALPTPGHDAAVLPISIPLRLYTAGTVSSLKSLQDRIEQAGLLPPGMFISSLVAIAQNCVFICYLCYCCRMDCISEFGGNEDDRAASVLQAAVSHS